jgi:hypothetical protein
MARRDVAFWRQLALAADGRVLNSDAAPDA